MFALRHNLVLLLLLFLVVASVSFGEAAIYRYVDADGRIHFTNVPTNTNFHFYRDEGNRYSISGLIAHNAKKFQLDAALIKAVIKVESDYDANTVSNKGAQGLMQLMPGTAREVGVTNPFDPTQNIYGGSYYLRKMLDSFDSNLEYALAAYNAGPGAVRRFGGIPPYQETRNYVNRVKYYLEYYRQNKDLL